MAALTSRKLFVNLAVRDLKTSMDFFSTLGFSFNPKFTDEKAACMIISDEAFVMLIEAAGAQAVIPPRKTRRELRAYDRDAYRERHLIECFFNRLKQFRRVATRYEKLACNFLSMINLAAAFIWLL